MSIVALKRRLDLLFCDKKYVHVNILIILIVLNKMSIFETSDNFIVCLPTFWTVHLEQQQVEVCGFLPPGGSLGFCMQDLIEPVF